jgi:hypothetical protein
MYYPPLIFRNKSRKKERPQKKKPQFLSQRREDYTRRREKIFAAVNDFDKLVRRRLLFSLYAAEKQAFSEMATFCSPRKHASNGARYH